MPGLQLSGLASGFDWKSVVDQLIQLERVPQDRLRSEKTRNTSKLTALSTLRTRLTSLQDAAKALTTTSSFSNRTVAQGDPSLNWSATAAGGAATGDYSFNVTRLATRSIRTGAADASLGLAATNDVSALVVSEMRLGRAVGAGSFTVNGQSVTVAATDTLQDVFDRIATATGGAVTAGYDASTDRVTLQSGGAITLGSGVDTSNFLYALKLHNNDTGTITSASALGTLALSEPIADSGLRDAITAVDGDGAGSFSINGVTIGFNRNTDTIQGVMTRVNDSAAGVTMAYDAVNDRFTLTNKNTGDFGLEVTEAPGGFLAALRLGPTASVARGTNAEFTVNGGGTVVSASNSFAASEHGVAGLTVTATSLGAQTISLATDAAGVEADIRTFIARYNDLQRFVDDQTRVTTGTDGRVSAALLADNRELTDIARGVRTIAFAEVSGLSGTIRRLESLGIDFEGGSSQLAVRDEAKLSEAISGRLPEVAALFASATTGLSARLDTYLANLTATGGNVASQESTLERANRSLDTQIADLERRLSAERTRLEASFIRMEQAQSAANNQLSALQSTLNLK